MVGRWSEALLGSMRPNTRFSWPRLRTSGTVYWDAPLGSPVTSGPLRRKHMDLVKRGSVSVPLVEEQYTLCCVRGPCPHTPEMVPWGGLGDHRLNVISPSKQWATLHRSPCQPSCCHSCGTHTMSCAELLS